MIELQELREQWEGKNSMVVAEKEERVGGQHVGSLIVTRDDLEQGFYRCFRYFHIMSAGWQVSVDGDQVSAETVMKWLVEPSAMTCRRAEEEATQQADFVRYHTFVKVFDCDLDAWQAFLDNDATERQMEEDQPFVDWLRQELEDDNDLINRIRAMVAEECESL